MKWQSKIDAARGRAPHRGPLRRVPENARLGLAKARPERSPPQSDADDILCQPDDLNARKQFHYGKPQKKGSEWIDPDLLKGIECTLFEGSCRRRPRGGRAFDGSREGWRMGIDAFSEDELANVERDYAEGLSSEEIVGLFASKGMKFTEATLRKYVQLGLLPRSRRVGLKTKQRGSQGLYPASVVRRIQRLKAMLATYSMEQIQREFLFVRADVEELEGTLERIFLALSSAANGARPTAGAPRVVSRELSDARALAAELVAKLTSVETRLAMQARLQRDGMISRRGTELVAG